MARLTAEKWEEIKAIYAIGQEPVLTIAERFGVSHTAINKKAKSENWERLDGVTVAKAIESRAALKSEVSKVSKSMKLETLHVETEIDKHAMIKAKTMRNSELLADAIPAMIPLCDTPVQLKTLADANKVIAETGVDKGSLININNTNAQQNQNYFADALAEVRTATSTIVHEE